MVNRNKETKSKIAKDRKQIWEQALCYRECHAFGNIFQLGRLFIVRVGLLLHFKCVRKIEYVFI